MSGTVRWGEVAVISVLLCFPQTCCPTINYSRCHSLSFISSLESEISFRTPQCLGDENVSSQEQDAANNLCVTAETKPSRVLETTWDSLQGHHQVENFSHPSRMSDIFSGSFFGRNLRRLRPGWHSIQAGHMAASGRLLLDAEKPSVGMCMQR